MQPVRGLADKGAPTADEYRDAALTVVACINAAGARASLSEPVRPGAGFGFDVAPGDLDGSALDAVMERCEDNEYLTLQARYLTSIRPTAEETKTYLVACVWALGLGAPDMSAGEAEKIVADLTQNDPRATEAQQCVADAYLGG